MIGLETYKLAGWVVEEQRQKNRHTDDPRRYPWSESDMAFLNQAYSFFQTSLTPKPEFDPADPKFTEKMAEYAQDLINDYQNVSASSVPNLDELVSDYERFLSRQQEQIDQQAQLKPKLAPARIELIKRLTATLPNVDSPTVEFIANRTVLDITPDQWPQTLRQSATDIQLLAEVTHTLVNPESVVVCLEASSDYLAAEIPDFSQVLQFAAEVSPDLAGYTATAAAIGFSPSVLTPSPQFVSASLIAAPSATVSIKSQSLANTQIQLKHIFSQIQEVINYHQNITAQINKKLATSGLRDEDRQMAAEVIKYHILPPLVLASSYTKNQPEDKKAISSVERVFAQIGLTQYLDGRRVAVSAARQTVIAGFLKSLSYEFAYYNTPLQVQNFYQHRANASPQMERFFNNLLDFGVGQVKDKATQVVLDKFWATSAGQGLRSALGLGAKAAVTAGTEAVVVGAEVAAGPPGWVLAAATLLATFGKDILSWAKRNFKKLAVAIGATIGLLVGGPVGAVIGAVGGFVITFPIVSLSTAANSVGVGISRLSTALVGLVATEIATPVIIIALSVPIVIALLLFIINTSALVVPPNMYTASSSANFAYTGPLPEGCPTIWPTQDSATINQGAWVPASVYIDASHKNVEALDIGVGYKQVFATHNGIAFPKVGDGGFATYGNFVDVYSTCTYKNVPLRIISRYAHLSSFLVAPNTPVQKGQAVAISGNSGGVQLHLHYEFRQDNGTVYGLATNLQTDAAPFMWPEFIPSSSLIPRGCWSYNDTGAKLPCNTIIP